ncbi:MAG: tol-pal system YbgF family protein [Candidatus Eisenbacteria bacterium]
MPRVLRRLLIAAPALVLLGSCAYYNTYFMAKRYYSQATMGLPYAVDKPDPGRLPNFGKSVDYCKKLLANYPKSKYVDDAYLLWARGLIGKDDPGAAVDMLRTFTDRYPKSPLRAEATFFLGLAYRLTHKYTEAVTSLEDYRRLAPKGDLVPYALLEESRALSSLRRFDDAAAVADTLAERFPKHVLHDRALLARADARLAIGDYQRARGDYHTLGARADNDEDRFRWMLKEADCLEAGHEYDESLALLRDAISHEREPVLSDTTGKPGLGFVPTSANPIGDHWGQLKLRIGSVYTLMSRQPEALAAFNDVLLHYWRTPLAAEAQYRIGYLYEVVADDFDAARREYNKVKDQSVSSVYAAQATQRMQNLDRLAQFRVAGGDSVAKAAEASFMRAELYLFQNDKPQRALEEYRSVSDRFSGTPWDAKAKLAQAWVLSHRMRDSTAADSLLWVIVRDHPATEAQLAARDYLEAWGETVPDSLIKMPEHPLLAVTDSVALTPPPGTDPRLGMGGAVASDSALRLGMRGNMYGSSYHQPTQQDSLLYGQRPAAVTASVDSLARVVATTDSLARAASAAKSDSLSHGKAVVAPDSLGAKPKPVPGPGPPPAPPPISPAPARPDSLP